ncbi:hypothetical protein GT037_006312 [Alternaria burnsii]|uniref:non-specific serine/threonine protein kinase n=1 Tax=Alternaria burnsii TaxID=1187904 RepID=A0A8H7BAA4_9PLEO|nr:uncharacterized protein GT037_006312 [Alternaria burnsii]KAF7675593.1 hypothetical protein GT037_006312 [Alternaria burnsii]CAI9632631.1 unnamed protein product [Alternaria burnsii]
MSEEPYRRHTLEVSTPSKLSSDWVEVEPHFVYERKSDIPFVSQSFLGNGSFGWVDLVKQKDEYGDDRCFARKNIRIRSGRSKTQLESINNEVSIVRRLQHMHITQVISTYLCERHFGIIMSPVADISLNEWMEQDEISGTRSEEELKLLPKWSQCLAHALAYIHDQKIRHKDIKPANILIKGPDILITDFGIAKDLIDDDTTGSTSADVLRTKLYSAPEVMADHARRGRAADIFSLGCVLVEMVTVFLRESLVEFANFRGSEGPHLRPYFASLHKTIQWTNNLLETSKNIAQQVSIPREWILLPLSLLQHEPQKRPTAIDVFQQLSAIPFGDIRRCQQCHNSTGLMLERVASYDALRNYDTSSAKQDFLKDSGLTTATAPTSMTLTNSYQRSYLPAHHDFQQPYKHMHVPHNTQHLNPDEVAAGTRPWSKYYDRPPQILVAQGSFSLPNRMAQQNASRVRHNLNTPSASVGSVTSHFSSMVAAGMEKIYILSGDDEGTDVPVLSRRASGKRSLIKAQVAYGRGLGAGRFGVDELVLVHHPSGCQTWENVRFAVNLTWRRRNEHSTNLDTFYIVSARSLDCDVVLGFDGATESQSPSDVHDAQSSHAHYPQTFGRVEELDPTPLPHTPAAPTYAYQQPSLPPPAVQQTYECVQSMRNSRRMHTADPSASATHPKHVDRGQPTQTITPLATQDGSSGRLHVTGWWDKTPIKMSFDPTGTGEAFCQAFHKWAVKRKRDGDFDRERMTLWLRANQTIPEDEFYELGLEESELEMRWESAVEWIQENKNPKAPHLFATVKFEAR